jgi:hypothetical protein
MPTIRIEYEVPDNDCKKCKYGKYEYGLFCLLFRCYSSLSWGKYQRCQSCIDAEIKEG